MHTPVQSDAAPPSPTVPRRGGLLGLVQRFPLVAFFAITCATSWVCWVPYLLSGQGTGVLDFRMPGDPEGQLAGVLLGAYLGPLGTALLVTAATGGKQGLRNWRRRLFQFRVGWGWYLVVLCGVPFLLIAGALGLLDDSEIGTVPATMLAAFIPTLLLQVVTTGLAEEPGWRDFALPLMQRRFGPLAGTAILGVMWSFWHLPLFFTDWSLGGKDASEPGWWATVGMFTVMCVMISYVITWVFNHTRESLPVALLLHANNNTVASLILPEMFPHADGSLMLSAGALGYGAAALVLLFVTRGSFGYKGPRDRRGGTEPAAL